MEVVHPRLEPVLLRLLPVVLRPSPARIHPRQLVVRSAHLPLARARCVAHRYIAMAGAGCGRRQPEWAGLLQVHQRIHAVVEHGGARSPRLRARLPVPQRAAADRDLVLHLQAISYVVDICRRQLDRRKPMVLLDSRCTSRSSPASSGGPGRHGGECAPPARHRRIHATIDSFRSVLLILHGLFKKVVISLSSPRSSTLSSPPPTALGSRPSRHYLRDPDLRRLQRLHRHRHRRCPPARLPLPAELRRAVPVALPPVVLAPLAHDVVRSLHDYLYVPLGGNRRGTLFTLRNLILTMVLGGLWHGAAWTFVCLGGAAGRLPDRGANPQGAVGATRAVGLALVARAIAAVAADLQPHLFRVGVLSGPLPTDRDFDVLGQLFSGGSAALISSLVIVTIVAMLASQFVPPSVSPPRRGALHPPGACPANRYSSLSGWCW